MLCPPLPKAILYIVGIELQNPLIPLQGTKCTRMRGLDGPGLRSRHNDFQYVWIRNCGNRPSPRRLNDAVEESSPLPPQRKDIHGILFLLDVFVFVHGAEFHAAGFTSACGTYSHALAENRVAFPAERAAGDDASCCFECVVDV